MAMNIATTNSQQLAEFINFHSFFNSYLRENFDWWRYSLRPKHDQGIIDLMETLQHEDFIRIQLKNELGEVMIPLKYYSPTGKHLFKSYIAFRSRTPEEFEQISFMQLAELLIDNLCLQQEFKSRANGKLLKESVANSLQTLQTIVQHSNQTKKDAFKAKQSFIETEQALVIGHMLHPNPKSRPQWNKEEVIEYSPETNAAFQLHYFLVDTTLLVEQYDEKSMHHVLLEQILADESIEESTKSLIANSDKKLLGVHPWQATQLMKREQVQQLIERGHLLSLGKLGLNYKPTSSIRTLYNEESNLMLKCSLNLKVTNSERINKYRELIRGFELHCFAKREVVQLFLKENCQGFDILSDPCYATIKVGDAVMDEFSVIGRQNLPFEEEENYAVLAALCQDNSFGSQSRLHKIIAKISSELKIDAEMATILWFENYLDKGVQSILALYQKFGMGLEAHQQNVFVKLDANGLPEKVFYRDNQGFGFCDEFLEAARAIYPGIATESESHAPKEMINQMLSYYLMVNNIYGLINAFGCTGFVNEMVLVDILKSKFKTYEEKFGDKTGFFAFVFSTRDFLCKGNLKTRLFDMDELLLPVAEQAEYVPINNLFHREHYEKELCQPSNEHTLIKAKFQHVPEQLSIRKFDKAIHLERLHEWMQRPYVEKFWKMALPIHDIENYIIQVESAQHIGAYVIEVDGEALLYYEIYWSFMDPIGLVYDSEPNDYGAHVIMAHGLDQKHLSPFFVKIGTEYCFTFEKVKRIVGEGDASNKPLFFVLQLAGHNKIKDIDVFGKRAYLTICKRNDYFENFRKDFEKIELDEQG